MNIDKDLQHLITMAGIPSDRIDSGVLAMADHLWMTHRENLATAASALRRWYLQRISS